MNQASTSLPSLAVVGSFSGALVGNGIGNDASSRSVWSSTPRTSSRSGPVGTDSVNAIVPAHTWTPVTTRSPVSTPVDSAT